MVEPAVVETAGVGDQADLERRGRRGRRGRRRVGALLRRAAPDGGDGQERDKGDQRAASARVSLRGFRLWDENRDGFYSPRPDRRRPTRPRRVESSAFVSTVTWPRAGRVARRRARPRGRRRRPRPRRATRDADPPERLARDCVSRDPATPIDDRDVGRLPRLRTATSVSSSPLRRLVCARSSPIPTSASRSRPRRSRSPSCARSMSRHSATTSRRRTCSVCCSGAASSSGSASGAPRAARAAARPLFSASPPSGSR